MIDTYFVQKQFKRLVTSEVLPSIRKHGAYMTPETLEAAILNPDTMIRVCQQLKEEQEQNRRLKTKVEELETTNRALVDGTQEWEFESVLNALIRSLAVKRFKGNCAYAWGCYYKDLKYKFHIDLKLKKQRAIAIKE